MKDFNVRELYALNSQIRHTIDVLNFHGVNAVDELDGESQERLAARLERYSKEIYDDKC